MGDAGPVSTWLTHSFIFFWSSFSDYLLGSQEIFLSVRVLSVKFGM